jgi:hypothetical protein
MGAGMEPGSANQLIELGPSSRGAIRAGKNDKGKVKARLEPALYQAPAFRYDAPRPVTGHGVAVLPDGNENGAGVRAAIRQYVEPHAFYRPAYPSVENRADFAARPDAFALLKAEARYAPFFVLHRA